MLSYSSFGLPIHAQPLRLFVTGLQVGAISGLLMYEQMKHTAAHGRNITGLGGYSVVMGAEWCDNGKWHAFWCATERYCLGSAYRPRLPHIGGIVGATDVSGIIKFCDMHEPRTCVREHACRCLEGWRQGADFLLDNRILHGVKMSCSARTETEWNPGTVMCADTLQQP